MMIHETSKNNFLLDRIILNDRYRRLLQVIKYSLSLTNKIYCGKIMI